MRDSSVRDCPVLPLPRLETGMGSITPLGNGGDLPFDVRRVYYLYDVPSGAVRGGHAHRALRQLVVAASGSFRVVLDDGRERRSVTLNRPDTGLLVVPGIWRELEDFSSGSVCLVLASAEYEESDYVRDYGDFVRIKRG